MKIKIVNDNPKIERTELRNACRFMYRLLVNQDDYKKTKINIVSQLFLRKNVYGIIDPNEDKKPIYTIYLNTRYSRKTQLCSLAHELVHVKQFITKELEETWENNGVLFTKWCGKYISEKDIYYNDRPWETESFGRQYGIYKRYEMYRKNGSRREP